MSEIPPPVRTLPLVHACMCNMVRESGVVVEDLCGRVTANPDSPLCNMCIDAGHDDLPHLPYAEVLRRREERKARE